MRVDLLCVGVLVLVPACTFHSALPPEQRLVELGEPSAAFLAASGADAGQPWRSVQPSDLAGAFRSLEVRGSAATSVLEVSYHFERDGHYSGSALITCGGQTRYQAISGEWQLENGMLCLGNGSPPATARVRGPCLELSTSLGTVLLARR